MSQIQFYTNPMSRGQIVRWMLEEVGVPYETHLLDYQTEMKGPAYLAINPMGKVPAVVYEGAVVTECAAICAWLADRFPEAALAPPLPDRADYYRWMFFAAGPLEAAVTNRALGFVAEPGRERTLGYGSFEQTIDTLESALRGKTFICGEMFTAADVYVGSHIVWGLQFGTIPSRPIFSDYVARLESRPAYVRAKEIDNALIAQAQSGKA
ncbi:glutathione S-transferase [Sphingobium sp. B1D7B]|uniref:glutathione S-transferase family protein n=1 Tax=unclassified Sphingobium TaxID=2611147 RepID=UPI00222597D9|nr:MULTISPECIES: glutathione S-transferase family protein [unclassified Sphingobium]MCW2391548.1 glutathione S-transferase [Sphingobium sp. B11D3A]MCW2406764.1 glutathione S-transferase [Sphingobium sp. B1D7B]